MRGNQSDSFLARTAHRNCMIVLLSGRCGPAGAKGYLPIAGGKLCNRVKMANEVIGDNTNHGQVILFYHYRLVTRPDNRGVIQFELLKHYS